MHIIFCPLLGIEQAAAAMGISLDTLRAQIRRGYIPTVKKGRRIYVDVVALVAESSASFDIQNYSSLTPTPPRSARGGGVRSALSTSKEPIQ